MKPGREPARNNGQTYFVTSQTWQRRPLFLNPRWAELFLRVLDSYRGEGYLLHEYVLMPEHFHVLIPRASLEKAVQLVKGGFSFRAKKEIGSIDGISGKSTGNASRDLTNRMRDALRITANIHMMYPGFVFGFLHFIRLSKLADVRSPSDASFDAQGRQLDSIVRYHNALSALTGRRTITDPPMSYEAIGLVVYRCLNEKAEIWPNYPAADSAVHYSKFFQRLYDIYDLRYAYPDSSERNHRKLFKDCNSGALAVEVDAATGCPCTSRLWAETPGNQQRF